MKKILFLLLLILSITSFSQEYTVAKATVLNNKNIWELQDDRHALLKRVLFYSESSYGVCFVFANSTVRCYGINDWTIEGTTYTLENRNGISYKIEFDEITKEVTYLYLTLDLTINDEDLGEVKRTTQFRFEF